MRMEADWPVTARLGEQMVPQSSLVHPPQGASLVQSKRARLKEHRLTENTIGLVCALGEHKD